MSSKSHILTKALKFITRRTWLNGSTSLILISYPVNKGFDPQTQRTSHFQFNKESQSAANRTQADSPKTEAAHTAAC